MCVNSFDAFLAWQRLTEKLFLHCKENLFIPVFLLLVPFLLNSDFSTTGEVLSLSFSWLELQLNVGTRKYTELKLDK